MMTFTSDSLNKLLMRYQLYVLVAISLISVLLEIYSLSEGITIVFPHIFYIPVIAAAYLYPRRGVPFAVGLGIIYLVILVLMGYHDGNILTAAGVRVVVYIGIAAVVSYLAYELKKEALSFRTLFESAGTAMLVIDEDGLISGANSKMEKISGYSRDEVVGRMKWSSFVSPDDLKRMEEYHRLRRNKDQTTAPGHYEFPFMRFLPQVPADLQTTAPGHYEFSFMAKGDRRVDAYLTIVMIPETTTSMASIMDITALKKAQNELRVSELWFRTVWDNIQAGIVVVDADRHIIVSVNHAATEILGYTEEQIKGNICHKFICPAEVGKCPISDLGQNLDSSERIVLNSRGEEVPVLKSVVKIVVEDHEYFVENFVDITALKKAEAALVAERERLAVTLRSIGDGVIATDTDGRVVSLNKVAEDLTRWSDDEASGRPLSEVFDIINEETRERCENPVDRIVETGLVTDLAKHAALIARDGTELVIADSGAPIRDKENNIIGIVIVFRDITAEREAEEELQRYTYNLGERVKELSCLYRISDLIEENLSSEELLLGVVELIPPACEYPEFSCAQIIIDNKEFRTENFRETIWKQASKIVVNGRQTGTMEVCYLEKKPESEKRRFLKEEQALLNVIAERIGKVIERKEAQNELLAYITEASLRIKNPAELIRNNMADILSQIEEGDTSLEHIKMQIIIQIKNTDKVIDNLRELDRAIAEHRKEIPDEFKKFLSR